jgi:hypothetical protein
MACLGVQRRAFLAGCTGIGKTMFIYGMVGGMASGQGFLHWTWGVEKRGTTEEIGGPSFHEAATSLPNG